ncbi:hypothetical protein ACGC1H_001514 [Rhizoctonia solani]
MEVLKPTWQGHENLERVFIFGDSYSSVLNLITNENAPNPTADLPLGVPFPGDTWTDGEKPNWVGYLLKTWPFERPLLIHDFAIGGDTVPKMEAIINGPYQDLVGRRCRCNEHWKPANSLFVFWIGINDLAYKFRRYHLMYETDLGAYAGVSATNSPSKGGSRISSPASRQLTALAPGLSYSSICRRLIERH